MSKEQKPALWDRMRAYAAEHGEPREDWLTLADKFEATANGFYGEPKTHDVKQFLGAFARARRAWCDVTGEALV